MLFITEADVEQVLAAPDAHARAVDLIESVLREQAAGRTAQLKRATLTHPDFPGHLQHNLRILPAMVPGVGAAAVRVYSGYRGTNQSEVICLFDWADMRMIAIISDHALHPVRTAAPFAVAAKHLALPKAHTLGLVGSGRYARSLLQSVCAVRPIERVRVYSRDPANVARFCDEMSAVTGLSIEPAASAREAVRGAQIAILATSGNQTVFESTSLEPGMLVLSLAPGEFDAQTALDARVFLSEPDQALADTPPRQPFATLISEGRFGRAQVVADLCDVVAGTAQGRRSNDEAILYVCAGMGILDAGIGRWMYDSARARGLGVEMPFGGEVLSA
jgi:alanine dehydrogenase